MVKPSADDFELVFDLLKLLRLHFTLLNANPMMQHESARDGAHDPQGQFMRQQAKGMFFGWFWFGHDFRFIKRRLGLLCSDHSWPGPVLVWTSGPVGRQ